VCVDNFDNAPTRSEYRQDSCLSDECWKFSGLTKSNKEKSTNDQSAGGETRAGHLQNTPVHSVLGSMASVFNKHQVSGRKRQKKNTPVTFSTPFTE
jgi:hypothetical protein